MDAGAQPPARPGLWIVALLALLYGGAHLAWYWGTPLGRSSVLDERENLQLAAQIAGGTLPAEPFYRAMGYPLFLAGLRVPGLLTDNFPQAATAAGLLFHALNTGLVALLARRWFGNDRAGWIAGLLHGLNPVLIHYATQILDAVPANTLLLAGLLCLPGRDRTNTDWKRAAGLSLAWAAAALMRPQLLLLWLAFPLAWVTATGSWRRQVPALLAAFALGGSLWLAQGQWSWRVSGEFRLLPWQGAYNLWAANHPGANGRYYTQREFLSARGPHENPARIEAETFYRAATGDDGPLRIDALNAHWREQLRRGIAADPLGAFTLLLRKTAYLAGNFEQYNNKTYAFHRERSPWLRWNPLGWGVILLAGSLGLVALGKDARPLLVTAAALAAGVLLTYASARFRLPLVALLCAAAGGTLAVRLRPLPLAAMLLGLGTLAYGGWFNGKDRSTRVQDHLLIALAAERLGEDRVTWEESRAALALQPAHRDALRLGLSSYFNLLLRGTAVVGEEQEWHDLARRIPPADNPLLVGLARWRAGDASGVKLWRSVPTPEGWAALALSGEATVEERYRLRTLSSLPPPGSFRAMLAARESPEGDPELKAAADRLFSPK